MLNFSELNRRKPHADFDPRQLIGMPGGFRPIETVQPRIRAANFDFTNDWGLEREKERARERADNVDNGSFAQAPASANVNLPLSLSENAENAPAAAAAEQNPLLIQNARINDLNEQRRVLRDLPIEDRNGRWRTGLKAALAEIAQTFSMKNGMVQDWDEFFARLGGAGIGGFVGGAVNKKWDENAERQRELGNLDDSIKRETAVRDDLGEQAELELNQRYKQTQLGELAAKPERDAQAAAAKAAEKTRDNLLGQLRNIPRYKRGENPAFDQQIDAAGITQPDFDKSRGSRPPAQYWANGTRMTTDENGFAVPVATKDGAPLVDPSQVGVRDQYGNVVKPAVDSASRTQRAVLESNTNFQNAQNNYEATNDLNETNGQISAANQLLEAASARVSQLENEINSLTSAVNAYGSVNWAYLDENDPASAKEARKNRDEASKRLDELRSEQTRARAEQTKQSAEIVRLRGRIKNSPPPQKQLPNVRRSGRSRVAPRVSAEQLQDLMR